MHIKPTAIRKLMKETLGDIPISNSAYQVLADRLEILAENISLRAQQIQKEENENRIEHQKIPPLKKLRDNHIKKAIRELVENV